MDALKTASKPKSAMLSGCQVEEETEAQEGSRKVVSAPGAGGKELGKGTTPSTPTCVSGDICHPVQW